MKQGLTGILARSAACAALLLATVAAQAAAVAFTNATVIDGTGAAPIANGVVILRDGKVAAVGPAASVPIPADAQRIDASGKTIIPGIINAHAHVDLDRRSTAPPRTQLTDQLALYARYGITTVYSLGDDGVESVKLRDELAQAAPDSRPMLARLYTSGPVLNAKDPADGRAVVTANARRGVSISKIRLIGAPDAPIRSPAVLKAMTEQSHAEKLPMAIHMFSVAETRDAIDAGADLLTHSIRDQDAPADLIATIKARGIGYIPTLTRDLSVFVYESTPDFVSDPFFTREAAYKAALAPLLTPESQERYRNNPSAQEIKPALAQAKRNLKILFDAGIPIAMGTDTGAPTGRWQGYFEHLELQMMVESGLTPMQALVAATGGAAKVMRIDDAVGTLQPGRWGDLLVLARNPLDDIRNTKSLEQVWIGGKRLN
jgi:imidazolonepropionase-like amidohydrolase